MSASQENLFSAENDPRLLSQMFNSFDDGIIVIDKDYKIIKKNKWIDEKFPHSETEKGLFCHQILRNRNTKCENCPALKSFDEKEKSRNEFCEPEENPENYFEVSTFPFLDSDGKVKYVIEHVRDVTHQKITELDLTDKNRILSLSENRYRVLLETASDALYLIDEAGNIRDVNRRSCEILDRTREELTAFSIFDVDPNFTREAFMAFWKEIPLEKLLVFETEHITSKGELIPVEVSGKKFLMGDEIFLYGLARDIRERKKAESELRETEERYKMLYQSAGMGVGYYSIDGRVIDYNEIALSIMGMSKEEVVGKYVHDLFPEENADEYLRRMKETIDSGELKRFVDKVSLHAGDIWFKSVYTVVKDADGQVKGVMIVSIDISNQKKIQQKLERERKKSQKYLDVSGIMMISLNKDAEITLLNPKGCEILGYEKDEIIGKNWFDTCIPDENLNEVKEIFNQIILGEIEVTKYFENPVISKDGSIRMIAWYNSLLKDDDGKIIGIYSSGEDITERKKYENQIKEHVNFLDTVMDESPFGMWVADKEGTIIRTNKSLRSSLNLKDEELLGKYNVKNDLNIVDQGYGGKITNLFNNKVSVRFTLLWDPDNVQKVEFDDAYSRWVDVSLFPILDKNGEIQNIVCQWTDVSEQKEFEIALIESESKLKEAQSVAKIGSWEWDLGSNEIWWSDELYHIHGLSSNTSKPPAKNWQEYVHEDDIERLNKVIDVTLKSDKPYLVDYRIVRADSGETRWLSARGEVIRDKINSSAIFFGTAQDVTERKKTEQDLREVNKRLEASEAKMLSVMDTAPFPIAIVDKQDSEIAYWSKSAAKLFGHSPKFVKDWYDLAYPDPDYRAEVINRWKPFLKIAAESGEVVNTGEYVIRCADGTDKVCEIFANFISENMIVTLNDVTERIKTENALRNSEEKFRSIFEYSNIGIALAKLDGIIIDANTEFIRLLGYTKDELLSMNFAEFTHPDDLEIELPLVEKLAKGEIDDYRIDKRYITKNKDIVWIDIVVTCRRNTEREIDMFIGMIVDITERKQAFEELNKYQEKLKELVDDRTKDLEEKNAYLERLNEAMVGREFRIKELKDQIEELQFRLRERKNNS